MRTTIYIAQASDVSSQVISGITSAAQWGNTVGVFLTAVMMAIAVIAWMIHR